MRGKTCKASQFSPGYFVSVDQEWIRGSGVHAFQTKAPGRPVCRGYRHGLGVAGPGLACGSRRGCRSTCGAPLARGVAYDTDMLDALKVLGVWLTPDMLDALKVLDWLDDVQRSIAWAILDGVAPDGTAE